MDDTRRGDRADRDISPFGFGPDSGTEPSHLTAARVRDGIRRAIAVTFWTANRWSRIAKPIHIFSGHNDWPYLADVLPCKWSRHGNVRGGNREGLQAGTQP